MSETADQKQMKLLYAGVCRLCRAELAARVGAICERSTKMVRCLDCSPAAPASSTIVPLAEPVDSDPFDVGIPGASARRE